MPGTTARHCITSRRGGSRQPPCGSPRWKNCQSSTSTPRALCARTCDAVLLQVKKPSESKYQFDIAGNAALMERKANTLPLDHAFGFELANVGPAAIKV